MADKGLTSEQATILKSAENWIDWERDLKAIAISNEIWTLIGPNPEQPLKLPEEPDFTQEPRGDSSCSTRSTPTPLVTDPAVIQARLAIYNRKIKMYDKQQESIKEVRKWFFRTVAPEHRRLSMEPTESMHHWYNNLKERLGRDTDRVREISRKKFRDASTPLKNVPKDLGAWITNWETALNESQLNGATENEKSSIWFPISEEALHRVMPYWFSSYRENYRKEIGSDELSHREFINSLRDEITRNSDLYQLPKQHVRRGAFGLVFDGETPSSSSGPQKEPENSVKRTSKPKKRRRDTAPDGISGRPTCRACENRHELKDCWFFFPDHAPENWKQSSATIKKVYANMDRDPSIQEEVNRIKKITSDAKGKAPQTPIQ